MNKNILLFYPSNKRTIAMETLVLALAQRGVDIKVLTISPKGDFHQHLEERGVETYTLNHSRMFSSIIALVKFCRRHRIQTVHSHLQAANIIAVLAQLFMTARVIVFRHHFELPVPGIARNQNEVRGEKLINRLAKKIIVPSSGVYEGMLNHENVNMEKVNIVPYVYDFSKYDKPDSEKTEEIKRRFSCHLRLLICARHVKAKRHILAFKAVKKLVEQNKDVRLLVMDKGPETESLKSFVNKYGLEKHIYFLGFRKDFINYFNASDLLMHPSVIDASNSVVKEVAMQEKPVMACEGIGDFSDYIEHEANGFLFKPEASHEEWVEYLSKIYDKQYDLTQMGKQLKQTVIEKFSVSDTTIKPYLSLI